MFDQAIDWWELVEGEYVPLAPDADGIVESKIFPGLRLNVPAILSGDMKTVMATQQG